MFRYAKTILSPAVLIICIGLVYVTRNGQADVPENFTRLPDGTNAITVPAKAQRAKMSDHERLLWLERNGEVPEDADYTDWYLSQKTRWWGKPLDPKIFWKGRVVWNDKSALKAAQRHGRWFPPIPIDDPKCAKYSDKDLFGSSPGGVETANFDFHQTYREGVFWDQFWKTQPKPPEDLNRQIIEAADEYFHAHSSIKPNETEMQFYRNDAKNSGKAANYPPEEFTDDALFWAYVMEEQAEYERDMRMGMATNNPIVQSFFETLRVDPKFITGPLSVDQTKAANAWKATYLQRLRREKTEEQYIQAYLKAWNLSETEVFAPSK